MHDQRDRQVIHLRHADDAEAPHLDPAPDGVRRPREQGGSLPHHQSAIVADQHRAAIDQAQRQIGFAGAGHTLDQHDMPIDRDTGRVQHFRRKDGHDAQSAADGAPAIGRRTTNRAPASRSSRDSTMMLP